MKASYTVMPSILGSKDDTDDGTDSPDLKIPRSRSRLLPRIILGVLLALLAAMTVLFLVFVILYATRHTSSSSSSSSAPSNSSNTPSNSSNTNSDLCVSEACLDLAVQIKGAMDETVDPCEDFYNFTCGNWPFFNHIPPDIFGTGALEQQQYAVYSDLAMVLETDFAGGNKILTELSDFYTSCIAAQLMDDSEFIDILIPIMRKLYQDLGGWELVGIPGDGTDWSINSTQFIREKLLGSDAFYSFNVGFDDNAQIFTLEIEQAGLSLDYPEMYNDTNSTDMLLNEIYLFLTELANSTDIDREKVNETVEFEIALAEIWEDDDDDPEDDDEDDAPIYTVQELYQLWPYHNWLTVLQGVLGPSGVSVDRTSPVLVNTPAYFKRLNQLVQSTPTETLENYAKWILTWQMKEVFLPYSYLRESLVLFRQLVLGKPSMDQQQECVSTVDEVLPLALGRVYAQHILPDGYKEAGMKLVAEVREGLKQRMNEVDWLDSETRQLAIEKLEAIESRVAYPERTFDDNYLESLYGMYSFDKAKYVENYIQYMKLSVRQGLAHVYKPLDRTIWFTSPTMVNAYYIGIFNQITILEAIMRTPSFSTEWPLSMQYGALGAVVGHELTHGFDNNGRLYDKDGRRRMWWSQTAVDAFNARTECFVEQYWGYELFGIPVNGNQTLGENIADNGGVRASYEAFKKVAGKSRSLPGLTSYTDEQLFFIGFAQVWCSYSTELSYYYNVLLDEHSPGPFRVIGALSNIEEFSTAFKCSSESRMNRPNKCVLW